MRHHLSTHLFLIFTLLASACLAQVVQPAPPELTTLKTRYQAALQTAREPIRAKYIGSLGTLLRSVTKDGDLDAGLAVQQELDAVTGKAGTADGGKITPELTALKARYETDVQTASEALQTRYIASLETLQDTLTKRGKLNDALAVRQEVTRARAESDTRTATAVSTPLLPASTLEAPKGAVIRVSTADAIKVLQLKPGQPRLYDSTPLREIEKVDPKLSAFEFTAIPQRLINSYEIIVDQPGVIYAFGAFKNNMDPEKFLGKDASRWQAADGMIQGKNIWACFQRTVVAGEAISLRSFELQIAAGSIRRIPAPGETKPTDKKSLHNCLGRRIDDYTLIFGKPKVQDGKAFLPEVRWIQSYSTDSIDNRNYSGI